MTNVASMSCLLRLKLGFIVSGYHCLAPGDTPYNGLYGETPPERATFFRLRFIIGWGVNELKYIEW